MGNNPSKGMSLEIIDPDERLVAGWASVEIVDMHGELIPIEVLEKKMYEYMDRGSVINFAHTNKPVGKVLRWEIRDHPLVNAKGVWIVAKIYKDYDVDNKVWEMIKRGEIKGFSIGGTKNPKMIEVRRVRDDKASLGLPPEIKVLKDVDLFEISLAPDPANPLALIEDVNYLAKSKEEKKYLTFKDLMRKYKISEDEYFKSCRLCKYVSDVFKETNDLELAVRFGYALYLRDMEKTRKIDALGKIARKISTTVKGISTLLELQKLNEKLEDVMKPFGKWENFQDCVNDMKSKGYDEDSAKRICGSLQAKLEKQTVNNFYAIIEDVARRIEKICNVLYEVDDDRVDDVLDLLEDALEEIFNILSEDVGEEGIDDEGEEVVGEDTLEAMSKDVVEILKDKRPPKKWWERCLERTGRPALCGWIYYHHLRQHKPSDKREKDKPHTAEARARKRKYGIPPP